jgi:hypothetical protein
MSTRIDAARVAELSRPASAQRMRSFLAGCAGRTTNQSGVRRLRNEVMFASPRHHCHRRAVALAAELQRVRSGGLVCVQLHAAFVPATGNGRAGEPLSAIDVGHRNR